MERRRAETITLMRLR